MPPSRLNRNSRIVCKIHYGDGSLREIHYGDGSLREIYYGDLHAPAPKKRLGRWTLTLNKPARSLPPKRQFQLLRRCGMEGELLAKEREQLIGSQRMQVVGLLQLANPDG